MDENAACTAFPVMYIGRVAVFTPVSEMNQTESADLVNQCCYKVCNAQSLIAKMEQPKMNSSINVDGYLADHIDVNVTPEQVLNLAIGEKAITVIAPEQSTLYFRHVLTHVSVISSFDTQTYGFVCYVFRDPVTDERNGYVFATATIGLEHQIVKVAVDMFSMLNRPRNISHASIADTRSHHNVSFVSADRSFQGSARLEQLPEAAVNSFNNLNFLRPSTNPANSTIGSSALFPVVNRAPEPNYYRVPTTDSYRKLADDGTEYVMNNMLNHELWFHGTDILYSRDCLRSPGDFFVYKLKNCYVLRTCNSLRAIEDILLHDEAKGKNAMMSDRDTAYHSVSHFVNHHLRYDTVFKQRDGSYFMLKNPILRVTNDRMFTHR